MGSKWDFEPTANIIWTYRVTHIEWTENQPLGLNWYLNPRDPYVDQFICFSQLREAARGFHETQLGASTLISLDFRRRLVHVDSCRGWSDLLRLSVRQGVFDAHTMLQNKDLPTRIRYYSIPESSDRITWILGRVRKRRKS